MGENNQQISSLIEEKKQSDDDMQIPSSSSAAHPLDNEDQIQQQENQLFNADAIEGFMDMGER